MEAGAGMLSPGEADWPPELRLPGPPPPPPAEPPPAGMDDSQFLGSIMGEAAATRLGAPLVAEAPAQQGAPAGLGAKKRRGRPPKKRDGAGAAAVVPAPTKPARARREDEEEVVCFICFDGGNLVVCDRRGCPKVYHPACIKRDEAFFQSRSKWNCGWHICSSCEKAVHYMCYTCTYSLCKVCIKQGKFFSVRGTKGFCDTCFGTILLIESKDENSTKVDFDDINSWEYLFKLYWVDLKGKLSLTLEELTSAKSRWNVPSIPARKEKEESSDDLYDVNNEDDAGSDCSSRKRRRVNSSRKKGRKRQKENSDCNIAAKNIEPTVKEVGSLPTEVPSEGVSLPVVTKWASPELLEFVGHVRDGDRSFISQFDVQTLLLEYIKSNNLRDPQRKSQIVCDTRLHRLFRKARVAHFEMLKLLEMHFLVNETSRVNDNSQVDINLNAAQIDTNGYSDIAAKNSPDKRRRIHRKMEREPQVNHEAYAAVDMHNINLIYVRRSLMEDLIDDATFSDKIHGAFVRIKISGVGQKQDMYRLVKVVGTHKVPENYSIGKKTTNYALEILNLDKKEIITMDTISNHDFTEEECKRLRQSMKCGLISRLKVGDVQEKAKILQSVRVNDWLENEKQKLEHLRDRASETGRRKELRECVEKLQLLDNSEERSRRINEVLEVHVDSHMDPDYVSAEETDDKKAVGRNGWTRSDTSISQRKSKYPNIMHNHRHKNSDANLHSKRLMGSTRRGSGARRNFENFHSTNATDIPKSSTTYEAGSVSSSVVTMSSDTEPEKVWHYKDPSGNVQGPFTLLQLSKWISYFPRDLRVWLTFESEERSLLLTEVLSKQQQDFSQAASVTASSRATLAGSGHNINSPSVDQSNALSPVGYNMLNSSGITVQSNKFPERESVNSPDDSLSLSATSVPRKDAQTSNSQVQCQTKHSVSERSPGNMYEQTDLQHDGVQGGCSGESNHHHSSGALWSRTMAQMSSSGQGNSESHHNQHASWSQSQHYSNSGSQGGSVKDLNSRRDLSKNLPTQRVGKDVPSPGFAWSPAESRTTSSQHEGSCLSSTTNPSFPDEHHSSIASANPKSCAPATPIEDRGSSSPSGMLSHSERVPICTTQSAPSTTASNMCKMEETMNQRRTLEVDTSNVSVNQSPESKTFPVSCPDNQYIDCEFPSTRFDNKEPAADHSGLRSASTENLTTDSPVPDTCKMEEIVNQHKVLEADASDSSANHSPQSKDCHVSSPNNKNIDSEYPTSTPRSEDKEPAVDNVLSTSAAPENPTTSSAPASDRSNMEEIVNQDKTLDVDASDASLNQTHSIISPVSSADNRDIVCEHPSPAPRSENKEPLVANAGFTSENKEPLVDNPGLTLENKEPLVDNSGSTSENKEPLVDDSELTSENKEPRVDNSGLTLENKEPLVDSSRSGSTSENKELLVDNSGLTSEDKESLVDSSGLTSENKEPLADNSGLTSAAREDLATTSASASDTCKMDKVLNKKRAHETDASNGSFTLSPQSKVLVVSSPDNLDIERAFPRPTPIYENKEPVVDNPGLTSAVPENLSNPASASDACKMEAILNKKGTLETDANSASIQSPQTKVLFASSPDNLAIEREFSSPTPGADNKEPVVDISGLTPAVSENLTAKIPDDSEETFVLPKPDPPTVELGSTESDFRCEEEIIQKELYSESTVVMTESMVIDPSCGAESIDVSDVLESLMAQSCGPSYMHDTTALEDLLAASAEDEPQCSSPIALSPWGEPSYYQGDGVDSALWGVQDDPINDMWSLLSPRPSLQTSSGIGTEGKDTTHDINEVDVHENNAIFQVGPTPVQENVNQANSGASTDWVLPEQVISKPNDLSISSVHESTGVVCWRSTANGSLNVGTDWNNNHNSYLSSCEAAVPSGKSSQEASRKQECTDFSAANSGGATGNTKKSWNPSSGNAKWGSQRSHQRDRYSQISESWLLSSNYSRGGSRSTSKGQSRGVCKFNEK